MHKFLSVGIDVGSTENAAWFMDTHGNQTGKLLEFPNNLPGAKDLLRSIMEAADSIDAKKIKIGMEATSVYNFHLASFLTTARLKALSALRASSQTGGGAYGQSYNLLNFDRGT